MAPTTPGEDKYSQFSWSFKYDFTNANFATNTDTSDAVSAFDAARATWNDVSGVSLNRDQGSSYPIRWANLDSGVVAGNYLIASFDGTVTLSYIELNNDFTWSVNPSGSEKDIQEVVTHELGHTLVLLDLYGHEDYDGAKMMCGYDNQYHSRNLTSSDIRGVQWIYGEP